eukprot:2200820-Prymnesium_polylepis.1
MVGSHHGQAASCEAVSVGAEGQERVARAVVGSEGGGACRVAKPHSEAAFPFKVTLPIPGAVTARRVYR